MGDERAGILIVGGSSGVGLATAKLLAERGERRIALMGRDRGRLEQAVNEIRASTGVVPLPVAGDASEPEAAGRAVETVVEEFGDLEVLVSSVAGSTPPQLLHDIATADIEDVLRGQLLAPLVMTRAALPVLYERQGGSVVLVASDAAKVATPGETVLGAAMSAIVMFARATALEAKRNGVRVNAVTPSLIEGTPTTELVTRGGIGKRIFEAAARQAHLGVAEPSDVASLIVFLTGPESRRITGQAISVNGGISAA